MTISLNGYLQALRHDQGHGSPVASASWAQSSKIRLSLIRYDLSLVPDLWVAGSSSPGPQNTPSESVAEVYDESDDQRDFR